MILVVVLVVLVDRPSPPGAFPPYAFFAELPELVATAGVPLGPRNIAFGVVIGVIVVLAFVLI